MKVLKKSCFETGRMILLLIGVSMIAYILIVNAPIDPLVSYVGTNSTLSPEAKEQIAQEWGLNEPPVARFLNWANHVLHGDFGISITYKQPVLQVIVTRFSYSLVLMAVAWLASGIIGFFLGVWCGLHQGTLGDKFCKSFCLLLKSAPTFWLGLLMLTIFAVELGWFPLGMAVPPGKLASEVTLLDRLHHFVLPALTLTLVGISDIFLYTRQKVIEVKQSDFILYAIAKGENQQQIRRRHILRNVALPALTMQFASFSELFGGMALAENVFSYPGIGTATTAAALNGDVPLLLGIAIFSALFVFVGNLIANLLYGCFDPRMREER